MAKLLNSYNKKWLQTIVFKLLLPVDDEYEYCQMVSTCPAKFDMKLSAIIIIIIW